MQKCGFRIIKWNGLDAFMLFLYGLPLNRDGIDWFLLPVTRAGWNGFGWLWLAESVSCLWCWDGIHPHYIGGIWKNE